MAGLLGITELIAPKLRPRGFFLQSGTVTILTGETRMKLRQLPAEYFQCCVTSPPYYNLRDYGTANWEGGIPDCDHALNKTGNCAKCGAARIDHQIGLENTPEEYIAQLVSVFREVKRVLRDDGILWLNLGDSYLNKQLLMIPHRVALALQVDGWYVRMDVIWHKPRVLPESAEDRPSRSHEYVFMLTKQAVYYYDQAAIREAAQYGPEMVLRGRAKMQTSNDPRVKNAISAGVRTIPAEADNNTRNKRSVWRIVPGEYSGAHFAVMPNELARTCILAGSSEKGCCPHCRAPWISKKEAVAKEPAGNSRGRNARVIPDRSDMNVPQVMRNVFSYSEWQQSCACPAHQPIPCAVLDPFGGTGTTGLAAAMLARHATLVELSPVYVELIKGRMNAEGIETITPPPAILRRRAGR